MISQLKRSDMPEVAFSGRSNVGKSSLLNKLLGRKNVARVSAKPGKTVTINFFKGDGVRLVDLPGYGYAKASRDEKKRWSELTEFYFNSDRNIRLVIQLADMRHELTKDDLDMLSFLESGGFKYVVVLTKSDKLNKSEYRERVERVKEELAPFKNSSFIPFSSLNGEGVPALRQFIENALK